MQISDLVSQYHNTISAGTEMKTGTQGVEQLSQTIQKLTPGQVFEGSITSRSGDQVTISMSSGQSIQARLDHGVTLSQGQSVFFEVKSNSNHMIQIRPLSVNISNNPTLLSALDAAGLQANERNLTMVNTMMQEQMPIDAKSLNTMSALLYANPSADASSIVKMQKLQIPITKDMVQQYENYKANEGAILRAVDEMLDAMGETFSNGNVSTQSIADFQKTLVSVLQLGEMEGAMKPEMSSGEVLTEQEAASQQSLIGQDQGFKQYLPESDGTIRPSEQRSNMVDQNSLKGMEGESSAGNTTVTENTIQIVNTSGGDMLSLSGESTVATTLSSSEAQELQTLLLDALQGDDASQMEQELQNVLTKDGKLNMQMSVSEFLQNVTTALSNRQNLNRQSLLKLLDASPYKELLKSLMENSWTIKPETLKEEGTIHQLYEKLEIHMKQLEEVAKELTGNPQNGFSKVANQVQSNIEFIQQVNHAFTYVQLPLKFSNQSATGDLYVYANKKGNQKEQEELSAFLHFDLEHLGSTDISVKMRKKQVDTQFFMEDPTSYDLIQANIGLLQRRIEEKGYHATITVSGDAEPVNFITDILEKEVASGNGDNIIQRYSFDVKA